MNEKPIDHCRDFHHKVVDEGLALFHNVELGHIPTQAIEVVQLLKSVVEACKHIAAHCECKMIDGKRVVWRYQRGKGYQWVECRACAAFWELVSKIETV